MRLVSCDADLKEQQLVGLTPADLAIISQEAGLVSLGFDCILICCRFLSPEIWIIWFTRLPACMPACLPVCRNYADCTDACLSVCLSLFC